jgi:nucleotide-binding universal stress UspA family protein
MQKVVVGVDGSEGSRNALRWAAAEAKQWSVPLVAVWAWEFSPLVVATDVPVDLRDLEQGVQERLAQTLADELGATASEVDARAVENAPAAALIDAAGPQDLIVVGSRGHGRLKGVLLGSVSRQVVNHARGPVTVVRSETS